MDAKRRESHSTLTSAGAERGTSLSMVRTIVLLFCLLILLLLLVPFSIPVPPLQHTRPAEALAYPRSQFVQLPLGSHSLKLHLEAAGNQGEALILLHGFAASTFSWHPILEPLAAHHRVIAFDRPAFGLTERPMRESWGNEQDWRILNPYSPQAQISLTVALLDHSQIQRAILVGNSAGGAIAMHTALAHPERVSALVLIDPAVYTGNSRSPWLRWLITTPQVQRLAPLFMRRIQSWGLDFARSAWHDPTRITAEAWAGYKKPLQTENWDRALWELTLAAQPSDLPNRLQELTLPILVITGDDDRIVPTEQSIRLAKELPNAQLVVIPNCGHVPHEECPEVVLQAMENFLITIK